MSLTVKGVRSLLSNGKPGRHLDGGSTGIRGLHLVVANKQNASWQLRYQLDGKVRWMGLGSARVIGLDKAREKALAAREQLVDKIDPLEARRSDRAAKKAAAALAAAKTMTFRQCAEDYIAANRAAWRNAKHGAQWTSTLETYAFPLIGDLPVDAIDTGLVLKVLEQPIAAERNYPAGSLWSARRETASRLRGRIESILGWATVRGYRFGDNPARWKNHIEAAVGGKSKAASVEHHAALPYAELPPFMSALRQREAVAARALEFLILTAARSGEVIHAKWDEIDLDGKTWVVPPERMKSGRQHRVPLSNRAIELLRGLYGENGNDHVFVGSRGGTGLADTSLTAVLRRMDHGNVTAHGFRSTFRTWAAEQTNFAREVAEQALAHVVPDAVERAYKRTTLFDKRAQLMDAWSKYCFSPPPAEARGKGKVVAIDARR